MPMRTPENILISRTDGIGDVVLTLPLAGALRSAFPQATIQFLGRSYTAPVVAACKNIDRFVNWDDAGSTPKMQTDFIKATGADTVIHVFPRKEVVVAAYAAGCATRIGTGRRLHTFLRVNKPLWFSRKGSDAHEAQLNLRMLEPLGIFVASDDASIAANYGLVTNTQPPAHAKAFCDSGFSLLLHPKSHGSALEWPLASYAELIRLVTAQGVRVGITGTTREREAMGDQLPWDLVHDFGGRLSLEELMATISHCNGLVAASTGPLHLAAAFGIHALGLYSPKRPIFPQRWRPIGVHAAYLVDTEHPEDGRLTISPAQVAERILAWKANL